ncbi:MAG: hypothetical protein RL682_1728, partial [Pseudomonadota bacterium]
MTTFVSVTASTIATFLIAAYAIDAGAAGTKRLKKSASQKSSAIVTDGGPQYATRAEVMALADDIAQRRNLDAAWVRNAIGQS